MSKVISRDGGRWPVGSPRAGLNGKAARGVWGRRGQMGYTRDDGRERSESERTNQPVTFARRRRGQIARAPRMIYTCSMCSGRSVRGVIDAPAEGRRRVCTWKGGEASRNVRPTPVRKRPDAHLMRPESGLAYPWG